MDLKASLKEIYAMLKETAKNTWVKNALSVIIIICMGFMLFNFAFLLAWGVSSLLEMPLKYLTPEFRDSLNLTWYPIFKHLVYFILVLIVSWFILRSKNLTVLFKATYLTMPAIVTLVSVGIIFNSIPALVIGIDVVLALITYFYLYKTNKPWQYWLAISYVAILALCIIIFGIEI